VACSSIPDETLCHKLTAFVFAADPKSQKRGLPADRASAPTNVDARTKLKGAERELRNTAVFATGGFLAKRHPRPPDPLLPSKLPTVRRAHTSPAELLSPLNPIDRAEQEEERDEKSHSLLNNCSDLIQIDHSCALVLGHYLDMKKPSPKQILAVHCPTCGAAPGEKCKLTTGQPRTEPHRDRRLTAAD